MIGRPSTPAPARRVAPLLALALAALGAACTEDLEITGTCPTLCPGQEIPVEQVELQPVVFDTSVAGFPLRGTEALLLAAVAGTELDTRAVYRFDSLPRFTVTGSDTTQITAVRDARLQVVLRRPESHIPQPFTLEAYDVTLANDDSGTVELLPLFTAARRLGTAAVEAPAATDTASVDTLSFPIPNDLVLARLRAGERLRIGLQVSGAQNARAALSPTQALLIFKPHATGTDSLQVEIRSDLPEDDPLRRRDLSSFTLVAKGTPAPPANVLTVGGLPGRRVLLQFSLPDNLLDSTTIVRATLVLSQRGVPGYLPTDTLYLRPLAVAASDVVQSLDRRLQLAGNLVSPVTGNPVLSPDPLAIVPGNTGPVEIPIANLVGTLRVRGEQVLAPVLVLAYSFEGTLPVRAEFYSSEAPAELRPTLRLTYIRRLDQTRP